MKYKHILCIDVEATCWDDKKFHSLNEIIELGVSVLNIETKEIEKTESIIVFPTRTEISEFCTELTSLTKNYVAEHGISFPKAIEKLKIDFDCRNSIFASWGDYDRKAIQKNCDVNDVKYPFPNIHLNVKSLFAANYGYSGNLAECGKDIGIEFEGTQHRGDDDSRCVAKILQKLCPKK